MVVAGDGDGHVVQSADRCHADRRFASLKAVGRRVVADDGVVAACNLNLHGSRAPHPHHHGRCHDRLVESSRATGETEEGSRERDGPVIRTTQHARARVVAKQTRSRAAGAFKVTHHAVWRLHLGQRQVGKRQRVVGVCAVERARQARAAVHHQRQLRRTRDHVEGGRIARDTHDFKQVLPAAGSDVLVGIARDTLHQVPDFIAKRHSIDDAVGVVKLVDAPCTQHFAPVEERIAQDVVQARIAGDDTQPIFTGHMHQPVGGRFQQCRNVVGDVLAKAGL